MVEATSCGGVVIFRGKILTGIGSGIADLLFITALILIKKNKVHIGLTFDTFGILTAILAIVFFWSSSCFTSS